MDVIKASRARHGSLDNEQLVVGENNLDRSSEGEGGRTVACGGGGLRDLCTSGTKEGEEEASGQRAATRDKRSEMA